MDLTVLKYNPMANVFEHGKLLSPFIRAGNVLGG
jgi:hypothetical protein